MLAVPCSRGRAAFSSSSGFAAATAVYTPTAPRGAAAQQHQVRGKGVAVAHADDVADAHVAPGRRREGAAAEDVYRAGVHLMGGRGGFWGSGERERESYGVQVEGVRESKREEVFFPSLFLSRATKVFFSPFRALSPLQLQLQLQSFSLTCRSFFALRASSKASLASEAAITSTSGTMLVTGDTGDTGVSESAAMRRK